MSETNDRPGLGAPTHWMSVQAKDLVTNQQVIQVDASATIEEACDALIAHRIQSVPLYDSKSKSYIGMFDLHDLATYLLSKRPQGRQGLAHEVGQHGVEVSRISDMSHMNPFYSVLPETTVAQIVGVFGSGTHRVAVMESERQIRGILSQTR
ncbi:cell separation during budding, partial [Linderina macrospora]